ncbi:hypothetical protein EON62_02450 [archaeon]|nr:MAG: hypothetical protein EON62_02450 [archaeon]
MQSWANYKATAELQRASGGKKMSRFVNIPKLDDANFAGTAKSPDCTLVLTEGDSAKSLAIAGLSVVGRDFYGVFPLRGKLLNVREATHKQIMANAEIQSIVTILGLQYNKVYDSVKGLRYGHLMIMADQDHDGSHIKGLVINFLHHFWPSLLALPGFLTEFITPIVKAVKGTHVKSFFTLPEYVAWKDALVAAAAPGANRYALTPPCAAGAPHPPALKFALHTHVNACPRPACECSRSTSLKSWAIKYYKGLGTSTAAEAKEYFAAIARHRIDFEMDDRMRTGYDPSTLRCHMRASACVQARACQRVRGAATFCVSSLARRPPPPARRVS